MVHRHPNEATGAGRGPRGGSVGERAGRGWEAAAERAQARAPSSGALGAHYTPAPVVQRLVAQVLGPLLARPARDREWVPAVLDPACGDGAFLLHAGRWLLEAMTTRLPGEEPARLRRRVARALHGVDRDPAAVSAAASALRRAGFAEARIVLGNSLVAPSPTEELPPDWHPLDLAAAFGAERLRAGFHAVLGNPPFVDAETLVRRAPEERRYLSQVYETARGAWDLFCPFVERSLGLLAPGGRLGLVLPNKLLDARYAAATRALLAAHRLERVEDYSGVRVFRASVYPVVVVAERDGAGEACGGGAAGADSAPSTRDRLPPASRAGRCQFWRASRTLADLRFQLVAEAPAEALRAQAQEGWSAIWQPAGRPTGRRGAGGARGAASAPSGRGAGGADRRSGRAGSGAARVPLCRLETLCTVLGGATVSEAYALQEILQEGQGDELGAWNVPLGAGGHLPLEQAWLPVVNTGTLDPHRVLWGERPMRYLGAIYRHPVVREAALRQKMPRRAEQARAPKVIVAGMTRRLECVYDPGGLVAGKSTTILLLPDGPAGEALGWYLVGLLNAAPTSERFSTRNAGLSLSGGYLRVGPPQLRGFAVPDPAAAPPEWTDAVQSAARTLAGLGRRSRETADSEWQRAARALDSACGRLYESAGLEARVTR